MTTKLADWASELRQITKIRPSDASGGNTFRRRCNLGMVGADLEVIWELLDAVPLAVERRYDFPEFGGYLGNVG